MKNIVYRPTVLIPSATSPIPSPPRRNRRRHKLRVPCSECHCPTKPKSNNPSKCPTLYPLVRSKSAVVRSLYKKMCTPFTRSQTVDENMLRYYSSETSEYSVSEGYILKPERLVASSAKNRIYRRFTSKIASASTLTIVCGKVSL